MRRRPDGEFRSLFPLCEETPCPEEGGDKSLLRGVSRPWCFPGGCFRVGRDFEVDFLTGTGSRYRDDCSTLKASPGKDDASLSAASPADSASAVAAALAVSRRFPPRFSVGFGMAAPETLHACSSSILHSPIHET